MIHPDEPVAHPTGVSTTTHTLDTDALEPSVDVTCVRPTPSEGRGVVVWCHGLGASRDSGTQLAAAWAQRGYVVIMPTFADSIGLVARRHAELGLDPDNAGTDRWTHDEEVRAFMVTNMLAWPWRHDRIVTLRAVLDALPEIVGRNGTNDDVDLGRIGLGGHSFGAYVSQLFAGARIDCPLGPAISFRDERVVAVIIASGQGRRQAGLHDGSWDDVMLPLLNITGTRDGGATSDDPNWKCEPFELAPPGDKYQVVLDDGDHGLGGISGASSRFQHVPEQLRVIELVTVQFWNAHLAADDDARAWLDSEQPSDALGNLATYGRR